MPASSQQSPTSVTRLMVVPQSGQPMWTASIQGRCNSRTSSNPDTAIERSSSTPPTTVSVPHFGQG